MTAARSDGCTRTHVQLYGADAACSIIQDTLVSVIAWGYTVRARCHCQRQQRPHRLSSGTPPRTTSHAAGGGGCPSSRIQGPHSLPQSTTPRTGGTRTTRSRRTGDQATQGAALQTRTQRACCRHRTTCSTPAQVIGDTHIGEHALVPPDHTHRGAHTSVNVSPRIHCFDLHSTTRHDT